MKTSLVKKFYLNNKMNFAIGGIFAILATLTRAYTPKIISELIDKLNYLSSSSTLTNSIVSSLLIKKMGLYFVLIFISAIFTFLMRQTIIVGSRNFEFELKNLIYDSYQRMDLNFFKLFKTGDLMSRISMDVGKLRELVGPGFMYTFNTVTMLVITIILMLSVNIKLAIYCIIPFPFLSFFIYYFNQKIYKYNLEVQKSLADMNSHSQDAYSGIRVLKSFTLENTTQNKFKKLNSFYKEKCLKIVKTESFFQPIISFLMSLSLLICVFFGGKMYVANIISIGELTEMIMYVNSLTWPIMSIGFIANIIQSSQASKSRINEVLSQPKERYKDSFSSSSNSIYGNIKFENVSCTYENTGIKALNNISFEIPKGQKWLIIGKTGSGKSTLIELLMNFNSNYSGNILIDNKNIKDIEIQLLRNAITYIPQDIFLFSDTIENNIKFFNLEKSLDQVTDVSKLAQVNDDILSFKNKYNTVIGEKGVTLSGGQKQRISIARGLLKKTNFYLFDDCLSALDVITERNLIDSINEIDQNSTTILISHRIYNHLNFDKILSIQDGKVLECGTHEELMKNKSLYFELYSKQNLNH